MNGTFTLASPPLTADNGGSALMLSYNGQILYEGADEDYTISDKIITFVADAIPQAGGKVRASYWKL